MESADKRIIPVNIEEEMKSSYIDYSMSVIVSRALPDARDGLKPVQRRILYSMKKLGLDQSASYKKSARIVGDCFVEGTLVSTPQGLRPIEALERGDEVCTQSGVETVIERYVMPPQSLLDVTLADGTSVTTTPGQLLKVLTPELSYEWKRTDELEAGDHIVQRQAASERDTLVKLGDSDRTLMPGLAYCLGLFVADGWISGLYNRIGWGTTDRGPVEKVQRVLREEFGYEAPIHEKDGPEQKTLHYCRASREDVTDVFAEDFDLAGKKADTKEIPEPVLRSPRRVMYAFLSGLIDGDGSVHATRNCVHYGSTSETLIEQLQALLFSLGLSPQRFTQENFSSSHVNGQKVERNHPFHSLEIRSKDGLFLGEHLSLQADRKAERLDRLGDAENHKKLQAHNIPHAGLHVFGALSEAHLGSGWYEDENGEKFRQGIKYPDGTKIRYHSDLHEQALGKDQVVKLGLLKKLRRIGHPLADTLDRMLEQDVQFAEVESVEPAGRDVTYDVQVTGEHEFIANGMVVHNCLGKYHPHGDSAVYDAMVRMAQPWSLRYPLVDGQGNYGSLDGDAAAAMRYTEARMMSIAEEMLTDLGKETVDLRENFDGTLEEPTVLPAAFPNMLVSGADGIAVGMATKIPPHNIGETIDAVVARIEEPEITIPELMKHLPAPDFPTGGVIYGYGGVQEAYKTGRGRVVMRAKMHEEELDTGRTALIATELPYQVNKSRMLEKIADLVGQERIEGISGLRDESDREGLRVVIELKRDAVPLVVQNKLFKHSHLQQTFGVNMVALVKGRPQVLDLREAIDVYVEHRHDVVTRRTEYELRQAEDRAHVLEGLTLALDHLDAVITVIRHSPDTGEARENLMAGTYPSNLSDDDLDDLGVPPQPPIEQQGDAGGSEDAIQQRLELEERDPTGNGESDAPEEAAAEAGAWLSRRQADAILALRLSRLTGLERDKIVGEYRDIITEIERLRGILGSKERRMKLLKDELLEVKEQFDDERRTEIDYTGGDSINMEDLIDDEPVVVTVTHQGLLKRTPVTEYRAQGRGGRGIRASGTREDDYVEHLFASTNHDYLLFFTDHGQCYWLRVFDIPEGSRTSKGRSIRNLIQIAPDDSLRAVLAVGKDDFTDEDFLDSHYVLMATRGGQVKKTALEAFSRPRSNGIIAIDTAEGDELLEAHLTGGDSCVVMASSSGHAIRFDEADVRATGRNTQGVRGIKLTAGAEVVGLFTCGNGAADAVHLDDDPYVLTVSQKGYGKRTPLSDYRQQGRGGKGLVTMNTTDRTGPLVTVRGVTPGEDLLVITTAGTMIRTEVDGISTMGRNTQGVTVINLREGDAIADVTRLAVDDGEAAEEETAEEEDAAEKAAEAEASAPATNGQA